jgi:hypothetical protein
LIRRVVNQPLAVAQWANEWVELLPGKAVVAGWGAVQTGWEYWADFDPKQ